MNEYSWGIFSHQPSWRPNLTLLSISPSLPRSVFMQLRSSSTLSLQFPACCSASDCACPPCLFSPSHRTDMIPSASMDPLFVFPSKNPSAMVLLILCRIFSTFSISWPFSADVLVLSVSQDSRRGNNGVDCPQQQLFLIQKFATLGLGNLCLMSLPDLLHNFSWGCTNKHLFVPDRALKTKK